MKNGEGTRERLSSEMTTPPQSGYDPLEDELVPWEDQKSDDGEDDDDGEVSRYSSCSDSEFDRYCSANSAMGTPSICGSVYEFADSEFGSLKSFKLGGENKNLKNSGYDKILSGFGDLGSNSMGTEFGDGNMRVEEKLGEISAGTSNRFDLYGNSENFLNENEVDFVENDDINGGSRGNREVERTRDHIYPRSDNIGGNVDIGGREGYIVGLGVGHDSFESAASGVDTKLAERKLEEGSELVDGCLEGLHLPPGLDHHGKDIGSCLDEHEASLGHEHSEGEDSMFGYGSGDEKNPHPYFLSKVGSSRAEGHRKDANQLLMTSAVAFGSDDWDDFMQETEGNTLSRPFQDEFHSGIETAAENESCLDFSSRIAVERSGIGSREQEKEVVDFPRTSVQEKYSSEAMQSMDSSISEPLNLPKCGEEEQEHYKVLLAKDHQFSGTSGVSDYPETSIKYEGAQQPLTDETILRKGLNMQKTEVGKVHQYTNIYDATSLCGNYDQQNLKLDKMSLPSNNLSTSDSEVNKSYPTAEESTDDSMAELVKENESASSSLLAYNSTEKIMQNPPFIFDKFDDHFSSSEKENLEINGFYDEMVHEMEEILLDTEKSPVSGFTQSRRYHSLMPLPSRDGGSTASTSGTDDAYYPQIQLPVRIDGVEVIGAKQKKGDVSLSERLVGVKEYTVYKIRVWSGEDKWVVEHRYRDFCALYRQLKKLFSDRGWTLPPPWHNIERESRKIFGNASPDVITERSGLIQDCLQSILQPQFSSSSLNALKDFLSPSKAFTSSSPSPSPISVTQPPFCTKFSDSDHVPLGKTVSLVVQIRPTKPIKQLLDAQDHSCAGCHKNFDDGRTRIKELVRTLGWGKPRVCEYSGQLFCSSCHTNDTAVLPARVLHLWDFTQYPVSQIAKSYLDSIYDKPMLCVSAVNPFLYSKVPALQHVTNVRKRIGAMIPYVRCPFRRSIYKALGTRKYLLESHDFFALRDLIDLSKGMFAVLPVMVETVSSKILEHITEQCLVCCDTGIPCNARQACNDPSSLIFPFQDREIERCKSCNSAFHRPCFSKVVTCSCGAHLHHEAAKGSTSQPGLSIGSVVKLKSAGGDTDKNAGVLSGLFSKVMPQMSLGYKEQGSKGGDTVILMGSIPNPSENL